MARDKLRETGRGREIKQAIVLFETQHSRNLGHPWPCPDLYHVTPAASATVD